MTERAGSSLLSLACVTALLAACFGAAFVRDRQFGFRDSAFFYYPLYQRIQEEWRAGRWPLWDPRENAGAPLLANPAAAALYPGKVIYALLPYPDAARVYVVAHVVLAFLAMYALLRHWRTSPAGSAIGGLSYAFGAPVVLMYSNVIFLVGASWSPLGLLAADSWLRLGDRRGIGGLAAVLAMQVLGGDVEAAYLTAVFASGFAAVRMRDALFGRLRWPLVAAAGLAAYGALLGLSAWLALDRRRSAMGVAGESWRPSQSIVLAIAWGAAGLALLGRSGRWPPEVRRRLAGLGGALVLAGLLSGAQLLPSIEFAVHSNRASEVGKPPPYSMGVHPYRLAEWAWPNVFGTFVRHGNHYWLGILGPSLAESADKVWAESLYFGGLPLVLALSAAGFRGGPPWRAWLSAIALLGLLGSLNELASPVYWAREIPRFAAVLGPHDAPDDVWLPRTDGHLHDHDGGPYWFLASALPGFATFRFPGKLMAWTCLGMAGLAGLGWDRVARGPDRRAAVLAGTLLAAGLLATLAAGGVLSPWLTRHAGSVSSQYGPLDVAGALADTRAALVHGVLAMILTLALALLAHRAARTAAVFALAGLTLDLAIANADLIGMVPQAVFDTRPRVVRMIEEAERRDPSPAPFRVHRSPVWLPRELLERNRPDRLAAVVRWSRDTIAPFSAIPYGFHYTIGFGTAELAGYDAFFTPFSLPVDERTRLELDVPAGSSVSYLPRRGFDLWNTRYFVLPGRVALDQVDRGFASLIPRTDAIYPDFAGFRGPGGEARRSRWIDEEDVQVLVNRAAYPRAWVVHDGLVIEPLSRKDPASLGPSLVRLLFQNDELWRDPRRPVLDTRRDAIIETDRAAEVARSLSRAAPSPSEAVRVVRYESRRVELKATLASPGVVILSDVYYPGWRLTIDGQPAPILRVNLMMRGAAVEAGPHTLAFTYDPGSFRVGGILSLAGLAAMAGVIIWSRRRPTPRGPVQGVPGSQTVAAM